MHEAKLATELEEGLREKNLFEHLLLEFKTFLFRAYDQHRLVKLYIADPREQLDASCLGQGKPFLFARLPDHHEFYDVGRSDH